MSFQHGMSVDDITLSHIEKAHQNMKDLSSTLFIETPLVHGMENRLRGEIPNVHSLSLKLECLQSTGSFKIRGVVNQFLNLRDEDRQKKRTLVTMSAGNYGKAFAFVSNQEHMPGVVYMPNEAPKDRQTTIESYGCTVNLSPVQQLVENVNNEIERTGGMYFHSYDDPFLILGNASAGMELMAQTSRQQQPDIVLVCCGGGGLCAGVAAALKLSDGWQNTRIYGVEAENVPKMYEALKADGPVSFNRKPTIATGLAPPTAGEMTYKMIKKYTEGILLVSEDELKRAMKTLFSLGLVVEPSGAAAFAALQSNKVPEAEGKKVTVMVTGGNVTLKDLTQHIGL